MVQQCGCLSTWWGFDFSLTRIIFKYFQLIGCSKDALYESLQVNALSPIKLAEAVLEKCGEYNDLNCTVVNISSGDGELAYLDSNLQHELKNIINLKVSLAILFILNSSIYDY